MYSSLPSMESSLSLSFRGSSCPPACYILVSSLDLFLSHCGLGWSIWNCAFCRPKVVKYWSHHPVKSNALSQYTVDHTTHGFSHHLHLVADNQLSKYCKISHQLVNVWGLVPSSNQCLLMTLPILPLFLGLLQPPSDPKRENSWYNWGLPEPCFKATASNCSHWLVSMLYWLWNIFILPLCIHDFHMYLSS